MASRDQPVNGRRSTLSLNKRGNLVLRDAGRSTVWTTNTISTSPLQLHLSNTGNPVPKILQTAHFGKALIAPPTLSFHDSHSLANQSSSHLKARLITPLDFTLYTLMSTMLYAYFIAV
ncbi:hypothetical protein AAC387_Pa11g0104 [Persea americana]